MITQRAASRRGWEGPYRYHLGGLHSQFIHGWIVQRGKRWLHFYSSTLGRKLKLSLEAERELVPVARKDVEARRRVRQEKPVEELEIVKATRALGVR